jgi:hypothetical protein
MKKKSGGEENQVNQERWVTPLLPAKGKIPNGNSHERLLQGYSLMKEKGLPVDALESLI